MKNSMVWALIALFAITILIGMVLAVRYSAKVKEIKERNEAIVRRRVEDQFAAFQKVDLAIYEKNQRSKIIASIGTDNSWNDDGKLEISA